jgi:nucleoside-diphosphate-sugar epimerase
LAGTLPAAAGQVINLGGSRETTILRAAELVAGITGAPAIEHLPTRYEVRDAWATVEKSARLLLYRDATSLEDGARRMWNWATEVWERFPERREVAPSALCQHFGTNLGTESP